MNSVPNDQKWVFANRDIEIIQKVKPYTMTSNERIFAFIQSIKYH